MQLNLLQGDLLFPDAPQDSKAAPPKKIKQQKPQPDLLDDLPQKPLPASLRPVFVMTASQEMLHQEKLPAKNPEAFKTISEVSSVIGVPQHVLRFWESRFSQIKPLKLAGGRRYYRPEDMEIISTIKNLLYKQGYTIKGAKSAFSSLKNMGKAQAVDIFNQEIKAFPKVAPQVLNEKKKKQLTAIRQELMRLQEALAVRL